MICVYCQLIHSVDDSYPLREATRNVDSDFPRCDWHWRYVCSICGKPKHFNGITWCEKTEEFICLSCARSHKLFHHRFWKWKAYYAIECEQCREHHPTLDYLEFSGKHPWQVHSNMWEKRCGIDIEVELPKATSIEALPETVIPEKKVARAWNKLADSWSKRYTERGDINRQYVIDPTLLRLMSPVKTRSILDAGCGNGYLSRQLARKGAKVVGVDISRRFIELAKQKEKENPLGIKYYVGSICHLSMFKDETFDIIVSNIVLMDVSGLDKAIGEFRRVMKRNGKLVFSVMHPCFSSPTVCGWVRKPEDSQRKEDWLYWKVDGYFDRSPQIWRYYDWPPAYSFHRPLSDYVKLLIENDFIITEFEEPIPSKKAIREHYREFGNECERIPWFLVVEAKKQSTSGDKVNRERERAFDSDLK